MTRPAGLAEWAGVPRFHQQSSSKLLSIPPEDSRIEDSGACGLGMGGPGMRDGERRAGLTLFFDETANARYRPEGLPSTPAVSSLVRAQIGVELTETTEIYVSQATVHDGLASDGCFTNSQ